MIVTANGKEFTCVKAEKGTDFIKAYDENGGIVLHAKGITNFSEYSIEGGDWYEQPLTETEKINQQLSQINQDVLDLMNMLFPE